MMIDPAETSDMSMSSRHQGSASLTEEQAQFIIDTLSPLNATQKLPGSNANIFSAKA